MIRSIHRFFILLGSLSTLAFSGCGPSLKARLEVPEVVLAESGSPSPTEVKTLVFIDQFSDARPSQAFVMENGEEHGEPVGDVSLTVQHAVVSAFRGKGFSVSDEAPVSLSGKVRTWRAQVEGGIGPKVESEASLYVELFDPANRRVFSGEYSGSAVIKAGAMNENDVRKCLGLAMSQAISQLLSDEKLLRLLRSF